MKSIFTILGLCLFALPAFSQSIDGTLMHDGIERSYIIYLPGNYTGDEAVPLVFNFHGYTSNAGEQQVYGDFRALSEENGFIIVHPQGTEFQGSTHWNVGDWTGGSTVDDIGFTDALLDDLIANYNIDEDRVYSTGMSNGGFFSYLLACQLSDRFAAVASVTGSMTPSTTANCNATHPTPIMEIHGTADTTVPYDGNAFMDPIEDVMAFWVDFNGLDTEPSVEMLEEVSTLDGSSVEHYVYTNAENTLTNEHFKVIGGAHTWPSASFFFPGTNYDINASVEIWKFFDRYDINGLINPNSTEDVPTAQAIQVFPNPTNDYIQVRFDGAMDTTFELVNTIGAVVAKGQLTTSNQRIELSNLPVGMYYLNVDTQVLKVMKVD